MHQRLGQHRCHHSLFLGKPSQERLVPPHWRKTGLLSSSGWLKSSHHPSSGSYGYMLAAVDHPPDTACSVFSTMLHFCALFHMGVVLFTAVNLCWLVVNEHKLKLGKRDWRLLVCVLGVTAVLVSCGLAFEVWGPSGAWWVIYLR